MTVPSAEVRARGSVGLLLFVAQRSLRSSKLTLVLLGLAIAAGTGFQVANSANLDGFAAALLDDGLSRGAGDVRVEPRQTRWFEDGAATARGIAELVGARDATPVLLFAGAIGKDGRFLPAPIFGLEAGQHPFHVVDGAALAPGDREGIVVGTSLARRLGIEVGDEVHLRVIFGPPDPLLDEDNLGRYALTVRAVVSGTAGGYRSAFLDRGFLGTEAGMPGAASMIVVRLDDHFAARAAAARIAAALPEAEAVGWREDDPYLANYLAATRTIDRVSYAMVIAAIAIPTWALFYIHVLRRRREIAILAALGFHAGEIFAVFVLQSLVLALVGCAIGSLLGQALILYFDAHPIFSWESLVVRPLVTVRSFLVPSAVVVATAVVAGSYPAWRAARTDPARVLRRLE